jgi:hypothetical protein
VTYVGDFAHEGTSINPTPPTPSQPQASVVDTLAKVLGLKTQIGKKALGVALDNIILLDKKQQDYGMLNISISGENGVLVRMTDKVMRLQNLQQQKRRKPRNEAVLDSYRDLSNYAIIAVLLRTGEWH